MKKWPGRVMLSDSEASGTTSGRRGPRGCFAALSM